MKLRTIYVWSYIVTTLRSYGPCSYGPFGMTAYIVTAYMITAVNRYSIYSYGPSNMTADIVIAYSVMAFTVRPHIGTAFSHGLYNHGPIPPYTAVRS